MTLEEPRITFEESSRFIDVDGVKLHYNEAGTGPTLMTFHGGGPGANAWDNTKWNIDELSKHFHVVLMDMPAYGHSDKNANARPGESLDQMYARLIKGYLDASGIDKVHLYGTSQSGPAVLRFGIDNPDRIGKIILQSASPGGGMLFQPSPPEGIKALGWFAADPTRENMERMMRLFIPKAELLTDDMIQRRFDSAMIPGNAEARARMGSVRNADLRPEISKLKAPVLVLWGQYDNMVPMEGALTCLSLIPDVRVHIWGGGTGHFVAYEKRDEFNRLVIDFLTH